MAAAAWELRTHRRLVERRKGNRSTPRNRAAEKRASIAGGHSRAKAELFDRERLDLPELLVPNRLVAELRELDRRLNKMNHDRNRNHTRAERHLRSAFGSWWVFMGNW